MNLHCVSCDNSQFCDLKISPITPLTYGNVSLNVDQLCCSFCQKCIALGEKGKGWKTVECWLRREREDGWMDMIDAEDIAVVFIMSHILYNGNALETEPRFDMPDPADRVRIFWRQGAAIAYYTTKLKGTVEEKNSGGEYMAHTLDTAYVMPNHRRQGFGLSMLRDLTAAFPGQDVAVSSPVSLSMAAVVYKFLTVEPRYKMKIWEVTGTGSRHGDKKLMFYNLRLIT